MDIDKKYKNKISFSLFLISILTFFLLGLVLAEPITNLYVKNIKKSDINNIFYTKQKDLDLKKFWEVYNILKKEYYSLDGIKKHDLVDGAIAGMVESIGDKHSEFMTTKIAKSFNDVLSGDFQGIGAVVKINPLGVKIERILKGSPAKKYGLKKDDIIIEANDNKLEGLNIVKAVEKIKGPAGTKVKLKILRSKAKNILEKEVVRAKIKIPTVEIKDFGEIGYIALNMFGENSGNEFKKALKNFKNKKGLIIDLRDDGGGLLNQAVEIISNFIENGKKLVEVKGKNVLDDHIYKSAGLEDKYSGKIVILINENSASASEITAGALHDYKKAILVGVKSYGKGSVQTTKMFNDGSQLKYTIAKWFTPNGKNIDNKGIEPDIKVEFKKEDYDLEECKKVGKCDKNMKQEDFEFFDRQLEKAKIILKEFIKNGDFDKIVERNKEKE